ncbi:MAG: DUF4783 domain-containing protein [Bacteroidetes bacterium]|nr:DUF4783 domain-containing protein [Bacteroidota bacterium]
MKKLLFLLLLIPTVAMVQPDLGGITQALRSGNADALGNFFSDNVEIALMNSQDRYSKSDAVRIMKSFFMKHPVGNYNPVHQGVSKGGNLYYAIGEMKSSAQTYRVYLLLEDKGGKYIIKQLRVDQE